MARTHLDNLTIVELVAIHDELDAKLAALPKSSTWLSGGEERRADTTEVRAQRRALTIACDAIKEATNDLADAGEAKALDDGLG